MTRLLLILLLTITTPTLAQPLQHKIALLGNPVVQIPWTPDTLASLKSAGFATDADGFMRVARSFSLHLRETNVAWLLRGDLEHHRPLTPHLVAELKDLLAKDAANQHNQGRVLEMQKLFTENPEEFLKTKLLPAKTTLEKGHFTVTTR